MVHIIFMLVFILSLPFLNNKRGAPFFIFSFFILFLFLALRYDYGNDYMSYLNIFNNINAGLPAWGAGDVFFKQLNLLMPNFYLLIAIVSFFYVFTIYFLISKNLRIKSYWFAILILLINPYLFLIHLSSIRQTIAICFVVFAIHFATKRKFLFYIIFIVIAAGFHKSAILLLPVYFFLNESKITKIKYIFIYGALGLMIATPLFEIVINKVLDYFPSYRNYVEEGDRHSLRATLISSFFFFLVAFNINKLQGKEIIYGKLALIATMISLFAFNLSMITRVGMYFDIFLIIAIPLIFFRLKLKISKQILFMMMLSIYLARYISFLNTPLWIKGYSVYRTILGM